MKIVQALEHSSILLKGVTKTIKNQTKEQKGGFLSMLLGTLGASLLGNLLSGKRRYKSWFWLLSFELLCFIWKRNRKSWLWKRMGFLMLPHL